MGRVPAGLDDDLAGRAEFLKVGGKSRGDVAVDPRFAELRPCASSVQATE